MYKMTNLQLRVRNTWLDDTNLGPAVQQLSLPRIATIAFDLSATANANDKPLDLGVLLQASLSGVVLKITDGANNQSFLLNKESGASNHTVSAWLIKELGLKNIGDSAVMKFFYLGTALAGGGALSVTSNDSSVTAVGINLYSSAANQTSGEVLLTVTATNVTADNEAVTLKVYHLVYA